MHLFDTAFQRFSLGLDIEGISSHAHPNNEITWVWGDLPSHLAVQFPNSYVIQQPLNEQTIPNNLSGTADFWTGALGLNAPSFTLEAGDETARALCATAQRPAGVVTVGGSGTTLTITMVSAPKFGDLIWIGDETIAISDDPVTVGPGEYFLPDLGRGWAQSQTQFHQAGAHVYTDPPYYKNRRMRLHLYDLQRDADSIIWQGFLDSIRLDNQQLTIEVGGSDILGALFSARGGNSTPWSIEGKWLADNRVLFTLSATGHEWASRVGPQIFQIGDCLVRVGTYIENSEHHIGNYLYPEPIDLTRHEEEPDTVIASDTTVRELVVYLRAQQNGEPTNDVVYTSFSETLPHQGHPASIALQLMCSTGTGTNGAYDTLGRDWGLGIPFRLIDIPAWLGVMAKHPAQVDRLILGWDENFDFEDVIINRLLTPFGFRPVPDENGMLTLKKIEIWNYDSVQELSHLDGDAFAFITPKTIAVDYHTETVVPQVAAKLGVTPYGGDPDIITSLQLSGNRTDYLGNSTPYEYDRGVQFKSRRAEVQHWLGEQGAKRRIMPPMLSVSVPLLTRAETWRGLDGPGRVPGLLDWIALGCDDSNFPNPGLIGPDGTRIHPNETNITFVGIIIAKTINFRDMSIDLEVVLSNWDRGDRPSMLIGPGCQILYTDEGPDDLMLNTSTYADASGESGFQVGDDVVIVDSFGLPDYRSAPGMVLIAGTLTPFMIDEVGGLINAVDDLYLRHADYSDFDNPNLATGFYQDLPSNRRAAYLADSAGKLSGDPGDEYV